MLLLLFIFLAIIVYECLSTTPSIVCQNLFPREIHFVICCNGCFKEYMKCAETEGLIVLCRTRLSL
jgi:hypothetical protein